MQYSKFKPALIIALNIVFFVALLVIVPVSAALQPENAPLSVAAQPNSTDIDVLTSGEAAPGSAAPGSAAPGLAAPGLAAAVIEATKVDSLPGGAPAMPGDTISYTVFITNSSQVDDAINVVYSDVIDANTTETGLVHVSPIAFNDGYTSLGNVGITVPAVSGVLANDVDPDNNTGTLTVTPAAGGTSQGGAFAIAADGSFSYLSPAGFEGVDSFTYTLSDGDPATPNAAGTVNITVNEVIWFVDKSAGTGGTGVIGNPFNDLTGPSGYSNAADEPGDIIFIYDQQIFGNYNGNVDLLNNQYLIGQGATASIAAITGITVPPFSNSLPATGLSRPVLTNSSGNNVTLAQNNTIRGINTDDSTGGYGFANNGGTVGNLSIDETAVAGTGGAINIANGGALSVILEYASSTNSPGNGINLNNVSGSFTVNGFISIINSTGAGIQIQNSSATVNFLGTTKTINTGAQTGINLVNNTGGTIHFLNGGLDLDTTSGVGLNATGGGTLNVTGGSNTVNTTAGTAVNIAGTTIGASGVTFLNVNATGGAGGHDGIILDNTGSGAFTVTGSGTTDGSGGTIQNMNNSGINLLSAQNVSINNMNLLFTAQSPAVATGAPTCDDEDSGTNTACDAAVHMVGSNNISLNNLTINDSNQHGINGNSVTNLTVNHVDMTNVGDNNETENGLNFINLWGTNPFTDVQISGSQERNGIIENNQGETHITIANSAFNTALGEDGLWVASGSAGGLDATVNLTVTNSTFFHNPSGGLNLQAEDNSTFNTAIMTNTIDGQPTVIGNFGMQLVTRDTATSNFLISGQNFEPLRIHAINLFTFGGGQATGRIINNEIDETNQGAGIRVVAEVTTSGNPTVVVDISGNELDDIVGGTILAGIHLEARDGVGGATGTANIQATVEGNDVNVNNAGAHLEIYNSDGNTVCGNFTNNVTSGTASFGDDFYLGNPVSGTGFGPGTVQMQGWTGNLQTTWTNNGNTGTTFNEGTNPVAGTCATVAGPVPFSPKVSTPSATTAPSVAVSDPQSAVALDSIESVGGDYDPAGLTALVSTPKQPATLSKQAVSLPLAPISPVNIGTLPAGKSVVIVFAVTINDPLPAGADDVCNQGTVTADGSISVSTDDPAVGGSADPTCTPVTAAPDLAINKSDGGITVNANQAYAYTLTYTNTGNQGASNVTISDTVPADTRFNAGLSTGGAWSCADNSPPGTACQLNMGTVDSGGGGAVLFGLTVSNTVSGAPITNTVNISDDGANGPDQNPADNTAGDTTPVIVTPDLRISKTDGGVTAMPGDTIAYTLAYSNTGSSATGVVLTDTVPAHTTFNAGASTPGWVCAPDGNEGSICTLAMGSLAGGASGVAIFAVDVDNPVSAGVTQVVNTADIGDDGANGIDPSPGNNSDSETTPVTAAPDLQIWKTDFDITAMPGGTIAYLAVMTNTGNQNATGVVITDTIPPNTTFNAGLSTPGWSCPNNAPAGTVCTFDISADIGGEFRGGGQQVLLVSFGLNVDNPYGGGPAVDNTIEIGDDGTNGPDQNPADNSYTQSTPIDGPVEITAINVNPAVIDENDTANLAVTFIVTGTPEIHTVDIDWGDGMTDTSNVLTGTVNFTATHQYLDDDPSGTPGDNYTINVTVTDPGGQNDSDSTTITVNNVDPVLSGISAGSVNENDFTTLQGNINDVGSLDTFTLTVDWGDGSALEDFGYPAGTSSFSETHQYLDDDPSGTPSDPYTITLSLVDDDTGSDSDLTALTVFNVDPLLSGINLTSPINENDVATLTGNIVDVGTLDTFTLTVDWGDGSATEDFVYPAGTTSFNETHQFLDDNPSGTPSDAYTVNLTLVDDDTGSDNGGTTITVNNVAPSLSALTVTTPINENDLSTLSGVILDPGSQDTFTLTVDWDDGSAVDTFTYPAGTTSFTEMHQYLDDIPSGSSVAIYTLAVNVEDDDTGSDSANPLVTVNNVPPQLTNLAVTPLVISETGSITLTGVISDPGSLDTFTLTVDWADESVESFNYPAGTTNFLETHTYEDDGFLASLVPLGDFVITLFAEDDDLGLSPTEMVTVTVNNEAPSLSNIMITSPILENGSATLTGMINEISPQDTFTLTVHWGDGSPPDTFTYPAGTTAFTETHAYLDDDPSGTPADVYTVMLVLDDDDGGTDVATTNVTVQNVAPLFLDLVATPVISENDYLTVTGIFTDVGSLDTFTLTVDWGDGSPAELFAYPAGITAFTETHQYLDDNPSGTPFDPYQIALTLEDDDTGIATGTANTEVYNIAPEVDAGEDDLVTLGAPLAFSGDFADVGSLDTHTILWDFGDGMTMTGTLTPTYTYMSAGQYAVTLTVTDDDTGVDSDTLQVTVSEPTDVGLSSFNGRANAKGTAVILPLLLLAGLVGAFVYRRQWLLW